MVVKCIQINVDRSRGVSAELREVMKKERIDVALIQEPYTWQGKVRGLGNARTAYSKKGGRPWSAVVVANDKIGVTLLQDVSDEHCTVVELLLPDSRRLYMCSLYCQYSQDIDESMEKMKRVKRRLEGKTTIIGADTNAKSEWWGRKKKGRRDSRGTRLQEEIGAGDWEIANKVQEGPTFISGKGSSYIDVTLINKSSKRYIRQWEIKDWTSSGHRTIYFEVDDKGKQEEGRTISKQDWITSYNTKKADWEKFREKLEVECESLIDMTVADKTEVITLERRIRDILRKAAVGTIPRKLKKLKGNRWWDKELDSLKKEVRRKRKEMRKSGWEKDKVREFSQMKKKYMREIRNKKKSSWTSWVEEEMEMNEWGAPYKLAANKMQPREVMGLVGGAESGGWDESAAKLLDKLVLDDSEEGETEYHWDKRERARRMTIGRKKEEVKEEEVWNAVKMCRKGKAPGWDGLPAEMFQEAFPVIGMHLVKLYNGCFNQGVFPTSWKRGIIRTLLKGEGKDEGEAKSYRPVCLLPVMGKIMERLIVGKLEDVFYGKVSGRQYGYMKGRSTVDAIAKVREIVESRTEKYVLGLFLDMSGAFDRVWWPGLRMALKEYGIRGDCLRVMQDYLRGRWVEMREGRWRQGKKVNRGCPQGSVLGPQVWKIVMDGLINVCNREEDGTMVAYADDGAVMIWGESRKELEEKGSRIASRILQWCLENKMELSRDKTVALMMKGRLTRQPRLKIGEGIIRSVKEVKYLGVTWGRGMFLDRHVEVVTEKAEKKMRAVLGILGNKRVSYTIIKKIYEGVYIPVVTYAAGAWGDVITKRIRGKLLAAQRKILIGMTKAYRTISRAAVLVISGAIPIDLEIEKNYVGYGVRKKGQLEWGGRVFKKKGFKGAIRSWVLNNWQRRWDEDTTGRWTYKWWKSVTERMSDNWLDPDYYTTQFMSGHGCFRAKLKELGIADEDRCRCDQNKTETVAHILFECKRWSREREYIVNELKEQGKDMTCNNLRERTVFGQVKRFAKEVVEKKEMEERIQ